MQYQCNRAGEVSQECQCLVAVNQLSRCGELSYLYHHPYGVLAIGNFVKNEMGTDRQLFST